MNTGVASPKSVPESPGVESADTVGAWPELPKSDEGATGAATGEVDLGGVTGEATHEGDLLGGENMSVRPERSISMVSLVSLSSVSTRFSYKGYAYPIHRYRGPATRIPQTVFMRPEYRPL